MSGRYGGSGRTQRRSKTAGCPGYPGAERNKYCVNIILKNSFDSLNIMPITIPATFDPTRPTVLCEIMGRNGSDKGDKNNKGWHNYTTYYSALFESSKNESLNIFELGLGTNNIKVPSNMGVNGKPGASLRGWREYFPNAYIFGADIDRDILFEEDRIKTYWCDQLSPEAIEALWSNSSIPANFDIIIEDGLHTFQANKIFFENSIHMLKSGGVYIIEDIVISQSTSYLAQIDEWKVRYPDLIFSLIQIPNAYNRHDNCIMLINKL